MYAIVTDKREVTSNECYYCELKVYLNNNAFELVEKEHLCSYALKNSWGVWVNVDPVMFNNCNSGDILELNKVNG